MIKPDNPSLVRIYARRKPTSDNKSLSSAAAYHPVGLIAVVPGAFIVLQSRDPTLQISHCFN